MIFFFSLWKKFFNLGTIKTLDQIILGCSWEGGSCLVHCRMFSSVTGLQILHANNLPLSSLP